MKKTLLLCLTAFATSLSVNAQNSFRVSQRGENSKKSSSVQKAVTGGLTCLTPYVAGETMDLTFELELTNTDAEWCDLFTLTFPDAITPNTSATNTNPMNPVAPTPSQSTSQLNTIAGQSISWGQDDNAQWGGIETGTVYTFTVNVTIAVGTTGDLTANYTASGDGFDLNAPAGDLTSTATIYSSFSEIIDLKNVDVIPDGLTEFYNCGLNVPGTISAMFVNKGNTILTNVPVSISVNGGAPVSEVIAGPIAAAGDAGDTIIYTFTTTGAFSTQNYHTIKAWSAVTGDIAHANDTTEQSFVNTIPTALTSATYSNGIESEYDFYSVYSDWLGNGVSFYPSDATFHSGAYALDYYISTVMGAPAGTTAATLAILPCTDVVAGQTYRISYWRKSNDTGNGMSGIFGGTSQDAAGMTIIIKDYSAITPNPQAGVWAKDSADYVATTTGTMYFAIGGKGTVGATSPINVRLDDINIQRITSFVNLAENNIVVSAFPNPTSDVFNIELNTVATNVSVIAMDGKVVSSKEINSKSISLNVASLNAGMYIYEIVSSNGTVSRSTFVKN